jgi:hypothetical protein
MFMSLFATSLTMRHTPTLSESVINDLIYVNLLNEAHFLFAHTLSVDT